jgi:hypothetical protein
MWETYGVRSLTSQHLSDVAAKLFRQPWYHPDASALFLAALFGERHGKEAWEFLKAL